MRREITCPTQFQGDERVSIVDPTQWNFSSDKDIQFNADSDLNASALEECDLSFHLDDTALSAGYAIAVWQELTDPGLDLVVWHYNINITGIPGRIETIVKPFISQMEDSSADSTRVQFLESSGSLDANSGMISVTSCGQVVRHKNGVVGAEDDNNVAFGVLIFNQGATASSFEGLGSISVHPITKPLKMIDPGI